MKSTNLGKSRFTLAEHRDHVVRVLKPNAEPYSAGSKRARAWQIVSLMDGLTVGEAHHILKLLEPNIQGKVGRPLGWIADAIDRDLVEIQVAEEGRP